jgi:serine/threonine-protein kinase
VKVLDFGLAKALGLHSEGAGDPMDSPTMSVHATEAGVVLGTAAYMSPEQAKGRPADRRADLWAFGVVLYEMLTGHRAFRGDGAPDTIARVLMEEPNWSALPANVPDPIRRLLRRCLEKDRRRRLDSASSARLEIDDALASPAAETIAVRSAPSHRSTPAVIAAMAGGAAIAALVTWVMMRPAPGTAALPLRFAIEPPTTNPLNVSSPDRDVT